MDNVNKWLTLIANLGIVAGLGLLILELNHSTRLAETEAYVSRTEGYGDAYIQLAMSADLAEIIEKLDRDGLDSLTVAETIRVQGWELARMARTDGLYHEYQQGFLDKNTIDNAIRLGALPHIEKWRELGIEIDNEGLKLAIEQMEAELNK